MQQNPQNHPCQIDAINDSVCHFILQENEMLVGVHKLLEICFGSVMHGKNKRE